MRGSRAGVPRSGVQIGASIGGRIRRAAGEIVRLGRRTVHRLVRARRLAVLGRRLPAFPRPFRVHLGCGGLHFPGWVNLDGDSAAAADFRWDLRDGLPFGDATCEVIYSEHVLEHLPVEEAVRLLAECRRVLRPGGVLRVALPSLEAIVARYGSSGWRDQAWLGWPEHQAIATPAEMLNVAFRAWGHRWMYDAEELARRLGEAGFRDRRPAAWGESDHPDLRRRESRPDSLLVYEART